MATITNTTMFGSPPNEERKRKAASQKGMPLGILYPLATTQNKRVLSPIDSIQSVDYFSKGTGKELVTGMLRQLFLTRPGERVMMPNYGLKLDEYLFEPLDLTTFEMLKEDILHCIKTYANFLQVVKLSIVESSPYETRDGLFIKLSLKIRDNDLIPPFEVGVNI
jgi:phage baseplate assembly protein W